MPAGLLEDVLAYCEKHPSGPLPDFDELRLQRHDDDTITVDSEPPEHIMITVPLLEDAEPRYLSFEGDTLVINVAPEALRYRPVGTDPRWLGVVFEHIHDREGAQ